MRIKLKKTVMVTGYGSQPIRKGKIVTVSDAEGKAYIATGYAAATALAQGLSSGDPQAQTRYLAFLRSGGSDHPVELLRQAGVDMSTPQPVAVTMAQFSSRLAELEQLLSQQP